jgi:hypothetical protein
MICIKYFPLRCQKENFVLLYFLNKISVSFFLANNRLPWLNVTGGKICLACFFYYFSNLPRQSCCVHYCTGQIFDTKFHVKIIYLIFLIFQVWSWDRFLSCLRGPAHQNKPDFSDIPVCGPVSTKVKIIHIIIIFLCSYTC